MDNYNNKAINKQPLAAFLVTLFAALIMVACLFLPYSSATGDHADWIDEHPDVIASEKMDMTYSEAKHLSMVEYATCYFMLRNELWGNSFDAIVGTVIYVGLVMIIGAFSLTATVSAVFRKPVTTIVFTVLAYGAFALQNWDYTDRGVIPGSSYDWGLAHTLFPLAAAITVGGAIWTLVLKRKAKKQLADSQDYTDIII